MKLVRIAALALGAGIGSVPFLGGGLTPWIAVLCPPSLLIFPLFLAVESLFPNVRQSLVLWYLEIGLTMTANALLYAWLTRRFVSRQ